MRKIPTLFLRDPENMAHVTDQVNPECQWVLDGEGTPTRKYDGTCVMRDDKGWWGRREVKAGKDAPAGYRPVELDPNTGKTVGWEPIEQSPFIKFFREAIEGKHGKPPGTYELVGPKINGNPEGEHQHTLIQHGTAQVLTELVGVTDPGQIRELVGLLGSSVEGVVWHHPDGRMAKLKVRDLQVTIDG